MQKKTIKWVRQNICGASKPNEKKKHARKAKLESERYWALSHVVAGERWEVLVTRKKQLNV